ncbi:hypothetical protein [Streptosporangium roseum]|uniref:Uncharacterized protein n=1 Tax=Streptosporangium roseum (strain ATCC 12428 / DSM 43021 / JCM 3005 / KCTC 9067 / NCIMB 10171 / NRRL 2505 / NI 9100) TaxID=479432 RepID=D2BBL5_STRRD|nr:hypothetical protein [Streptosporangium roseum]ACZ86084.1 hypothetical protein Sros_3137 [Streptosporangium roseum DSM 43021]
MTGGPFHALPAGGEGSELLDHLMSDFLIKGVIVVIALLVLALGMVVIWKMIGKDGTRGHDR